MIADLVKKTETVLPDETISKVIGKLKTYLALPIADRGYLGMVYLKDLATRSFDAKAKVGSVAQRPPKFELNSIDEEMLQEAFLQYPVVPIFNKDQFVGTISLKDYIKSFKLKGKACGYAVETKILSSKADIGDARNALIDNEAILVEEDEKIIGGVDALSLARQIAIKENEFLSPNKIPERKINISMVMTEVPQEIDAEMDISKAIDQLDSFSFLICNGYVITPKSILQAIYFEKAKKETVLELVGFDMTQKEGSKVDAFTGGMVIKEMENFAARATKLIKPQEIKFHLQLSKKLGKDLYHVEAKIMAGGKAINADKEDRELLDCVQSVIEKLDQQIERMKDTDETKIKNAGRHGKHPGRDEL